MDWYKLTERYHVRTFEHDLLLSSLPEEWQRELAALWRLEADVNNGAYLQFLGNWGYESYSYASQALKAIGAHTMSRIIDACQALVDEHINAANATSEQLRVLAPGRYISQEGKVIEVTDSPLPQSARDRILELSYEFMSYPDNIAELGMRHYRQFLSDDVASEEEGRREVVSDVRPAENNLNLPNIITFARLALSFVLFGMMSAGVGWLWSAGLFVFAVLTDILDGWIARKYQLITQLGRIMDPFVDKFITSGVFLFLLPRPNSGVNAWMVIIIIGREMLVTSLRGFLEQRGADFSASASGKLKMFLQCVAATLALMTMDDRFQFAPLPMVRDILLWSMTVFTVYTGYVYVQRAAAILRQLNTP